MKTAEREISCGLLEHALDAMQDMVRVLSPQRRVLFHNASYERCFGNQAGKSCYEMFGQCGKCEDCVSQKAWNCGVPCEKRACHNGRVYWVSASPVYSGAGAPQGSIEVFRDITQLLAQEQKLVEQNQKLLRDAETAARLQRELFVSELPPKTGVDVYSKYLPASDLGGDLFGCVPVEDKIVFYIADVAGHGVAAAMIALLAANNLRETMLQGCCEPDQILDRARAFLCNLTKDPRTYVTAFVGVVDPAAHVLSWASAGHSVPMLLRHNGAVRALEQPSFPLCCWQEEIHYQSMQTPFLPGDLLLAYSDGLTDLRSSKLDQGRLTQLLGRVDAPELLDCLAKEVRREHGDDVCMLLLHCKQ